MKNKFLESIQDFIRKIDAKSWPAFFMFAVVLAAAGALNWLTMSPIVGDVIAILIALFFGIGVLAWHIVESRTDDSEEQEGMAQVAKWLNVILDGGLLVLNLFRAELHDKANLDFIAFVIIGISAASHVVFFLLWTQNDPRRAIRKEGERALSNIDRKRQRATNAINYASEELAFEKWVIEEEMRLRETYASLPADKVNSVVKTMQEQARKQFEQKQDKKDNRQNQPHSSHVQPRSGDLRTAMALDTASEKLERPNPTKREREN